MAQQMERTPVAERLWEEAEERVAAPGYPPLRIVFATDGSTPARHAGEFLSLLPLPAGSAVEVVTVLDAPIAEVHESLKGAELEWARRIAAEAGGLLQAPGVPTTYTIPRGEPAQEILRIAECFGAGLIVLGTHGRTGLDAFLVGSVARNVAQHAGRAVLIARKPRHGLRRVVLAVDGSEHAEHAARFAARFPLPSETEIVVCHVLRPYTPYPALHPEYVPELEQIIAEARQQQHADAARIVGAVTARLDQTGRTVTTVREGDPASEILALAREQEADLILFGARGASGLRGLLMGSVADRLLKHADCSALMVP